MPILASGEQPKIFDVVGLEKLICNSIKVTQKWKKIFIEEVARYEKASN